MKITFIEYEGSFSIELSAETMEEAAKLSRFGMNRTSEVRYCSTNVYEDGRFEAIAVFAKSKRANCNIPKRP